MLKKYIYSYISNYIIMEQKYISCIILHAIGDTIGFNNGKWEFNYFKEYKIQETALELLYEFINLGGINMINLKEWKVSDDTLLHISIIESLLNIENISNDDTILNNIYDIIKIKFIETYDLYLNQTAIPKRYIGNTTKKYIKAFKELDTDARFMIYDKYSGGSGSAMRTLCIGLAFHNNLDFLIEFAIMSSKMTHNSPIGYLGGFVSAYFVYLGLNNVHLFKWPYELIKILKSDKIKKYILENTYDDYEEYIMHWNTYINFRFENNKKPKYTKSNMNITLRSEYHYNLFSKNTLTNIIGSSGCSCVIMAYDALLDSENNWEKLIIYSALHSGDSDTVAAIACGWYGCLYGMENIPKNNIEYLEFKDKLLDLGKQLYNKFYK
jgi:ADP-ribosylarginine hydrolase